MDPIDDVARDRFLSEHPQWRLDGEILRRTFQFADFRAAMGFVTTVALCAEVADHHPDIDIRWNKVSLALTTHEAGALTRRDTDLAIEIDGRA